MRYEVIYTNEASRDLHNIYNYIAFNLFVPHAAQNKVKAIMEEISKLDSDPLRFPLYRREPWRSKGLRFFSVDNYLIFYLPDEEKNIVSIIRIMYGRRNINKELKQ